MPTGPTLSRREALLASLALGSSLPLSRLFAENTTDREYLRSKVNHFQSEFSERPRRDISARFYSSLTDEELSWLRDYGPGGPAIRSAWETVRRETFSQLSLEAFLKTIRSVVGTDPPKWWEKLVLTARPEARPLFCEFDVGCFPKYRYNREVCHLRDGQTLTRRGKDFFLSDRKHSIQLPPPAVKRWHNRRHLPYSFDCTFGEEGAYLAGPTVLESAVPLFYVSYHQDRVAWESDFLCSTASVSLSGVFLPHERYAASLTCDFVEADDAVTVFAAESHRLHVARFQKSDGQRFLRFTTFS